MVSQNVDVRRTTKNEFWWEGLDACQVLNLDYLQKAHKNNNGWEKIGHLRETVPDR